MEFLYPKFDQPTHKLNRASGVSIQYPNFKTFSSQKDYDIVDNALVVLIRENLGYNNEWSYVRLIDNTLQSAEYYNKSFYVLSKNLINVGGKQSYIPSKVDFLQINPDAEEINPLFQEVFIPYLDSKNGLFSVRIQVDYERIVDMKLFERVMQEVYLEGVNVLLASRGLRSDNDTINSLKDTYYCFAYINRDLDLTVRRPCEPLTFTVSIPLNFFNEDVQIKEPTVSKFASNHIIFTNNNFVSNIEFLISIFSKKIPDLVKITYPDKIIENFLVDFEINSLRAFAVVANQLMSLANCPIKEDRINITQYDIGLDKDLNIISIKIDKRDANGQVYEEVEFAEGSLSQCRLRGEFNNKRIFNYLLNLTNMLEELPTLETLEYLTKYVKYPDIRLVDEVVRVADVTIPAEDVKEFRMNFSANEESCVKLSDIFNLTNAATVTAQLVSDPVYNLFVPSDPKNDVSFGSIAQSLKDNLAYLTSNQQNREEITGSSINITTNSGISEFFSDAGDFTTDVGKEVGGYFAEQYKANLNTLAYVAKRLDIQEILFKKIFCYLKGTDPNAAETAELLSQIPYEIVNYLKYLNGIQGLKGAAYIRALEEGISFDAELFCNDEVAYFIKGFTKFLNTVNVVISRTVSYVTELGRALKTINGRSVRNPYEAIVKSISKTLYVTLTNFAFEYLRDCLMTECDDPILDGDVDNFYDPFSTHYPTERFGGSENNNRDVLREDRLNALGETVPDIVRTLTFGSDIEYTIDLIGLLLKDINCILTASESIDLLRGAPSDEVIALTKNIIRNKYSQDPNNLSYLLNADKLKLFFAKLGLRVDQEYLNKYSDPVLQYVKSRGADVCTPEQYQVRASILNNKIPVELGVLADDTRNRVQKARELLEKVRKGNVEYTISALCPDIEDADIASMKDNMFEQYKNSIQSTFTNTLSLFTEEVNKTPDKYTESKEFIRKNSDGEIIAVYPYKTYNSNLSKNLYTPDAYTRWTPKINDLVYKSNEKGFGLHYRYKNEPPIGIDELSDALLGQFVSEIATLDVCSDSASQLSLDPIFKRFINEGRILYERRPPIVDSDLLEFLIDLLETIFGDEALGFTVLTILSWGVFLGLITLAEALAYPDKRDWESIQTSFTSREGEQSSFARELFEESQELYNYIAQKKYVIFIDSETPNYWDNKPDIHKEANFRLVYYSSNAANGYGDFILLKEVLFRQEDLGEDTAQISRHVIYEDSLSTYTGEWNSRKEYDSLSDPNIIVVNNNVMQSVKDFYNTYYPDIRNFYRIPDDEDTDSEYTVRVFGKNFLPIPPNAKDTNIAGNDGAVRVRTGATDPVEFFNITQTIVQQITQAVLDRILLFEKTIDTLNKINENGLFYINNNLEDMTRTVNVVKTGIDGNIEYKPFYYNKFKISEKYKNDLENVESKEIQIDGRPTPLSTADFSFHINSLYHYFINEYSLIYFRDFCDPAQFIFYDYSMVNTDPGVDGEGPFTFTDGQFFSAMANEDYTVTMNPDYKDICRENYEKITGLDYSRNPIYKACNLYPHYLNLQYFLSNFEGLYKPTLCDTNLDKVPAKVLDGVLTRLTIRTYITDQLTKLILFLSSLDKEELNSIHFDQFVVDVMREHMIAEMHPFTSDRAFGGPQDYYSVFIKTKVKKVFKDDFDSGKIDQRYLLETSSEDNKEIDYYIRKEIRHFIKFCIEKQIITSREISLYKENFSFIDSTIFNFTPKETEGGEYGLRPPNTKLEEELIKELYKKPDYIKEEYYLIMVYLLMTSTVDSQKRNLFLGTKSELARIFFSTLKEIPQEEETPAYNDKPDEDIVKFITKIGFSNNPAALAAMYPDYSKYVTFFLEAAIEETRSILLNSSMFVDKNITITRGINYVLGTIAGLSWSLMDQKERDELIADAAVNNQALGWLYKRAESAMSPIPDVLTSAGVIGASLGSAIPDTVGWWYLAFDTIRETIWTVRTVYELEALARSIAEQQEVDPCETTQGDGAVAVEPCCTEEDTEEQCNEKRNKLIKQIDKFEED